MVASARTALGASAALLVSLLLAGCGGRGQTTVTIVGYGTLVNETSARSTTPGLTNWRYGRVAGYARVFDLVSIINIRRGLGTGLQLASNTARPMEGVELWVSLFDIPEEEFADLEVRERRLRTSEVQYTEVDSGSTGTAYIFTQYSDKEYREERAIGELWEEEVGQYYPGRCIYRSDLLPLPGYLQRVADAYAGVSDAYSDHYLDTTFLGDATTSIRQYIANVGEEAAYNLLDPDAPPNNGTNCIAEPFVGRVSI